MSKIALVLSGGGFKGAFQVGALQMLQENWGKIDAANPEMKFDIVSGVSVGALNGLLVAQNKFDTLLDLWSNIGKNGVSEIYTSDFIDTGFSKNSENTELNFKLSWKTIKKHFPKTTRNLALKGIFARKSIFTSFKKEFQQLNAIADNTPLYEKLKIYAQKEYFEDCMFKVGYVSLTTGKYYSVNCCDFISDEDFAKGVLASTTMPTVWSPVDKINVNGALHQQCVDGGIRNVSPLRDMIDDIKNDTSSEEYTIVIINCSTGKVPDEDFKDKNIAQIALRALSDIAITEIFNNDIREFITKNYLVKQIKEIHPEEVIYDYDFERQQKGKPLKYFKAIVIQPDENILSDPLTTNARQIKSDMEHGRHKAAIALDIHSKTDFDNKTTIV